MTFKGTGVALITPFDDDNNIDTESLCNLVEYTIKGGVDFLTVLGTTAETATLSNEEKYTVVKTIYEQNNKRLPILVGIGGNNTIEVINTIKEAEYLNMCNGILSVVPYYNKPNQEGIYRHFKAIAEISPLPIVLYNIPGRTGVNMQAQTSLRLANDFTNIIGIKEASGNIAQVTDLQYTDNIDFIVLSGDDNLVLPLMSIGAQGVISVTANIVPTGFSEMVRLAASNNFAAAKKYHLLYNDLIKTLFEEGNPTGIKAILQIAGIIKTNNTRLPLVNASDGLHKKLEHIYKNCKYL